MQRRLVARMLLLAASIAGAATAPASAQVVQGRLVDRGSGEPIEGAFVVLLDSADAEVGGVLTDADGLFRMQAPAGGVYKLRADRIGHKSVFSNDVAVGAGKTTTVRLVSAVQPVALGAIDVRGAKRCRVRPAEGEATARVWEEARKALRITAWAQKGRSVRYRLRTFDRTLDPERLTVRDASSAMKAGYSTGSPFVSKTAEDLAKNGWVREVEGGYLDYFAPDADVLLSDPFVDQHCFRLQTDDPPAPGLIGLEFEPLRKDRPDIAGVIWLDRGTAELRELDYRYTRLPWSVSPDQAGGHIGFMHMPTGAWIVRRWWIHMPVMTQRVIAAEFGGGSRRRETIVGSVHETGGEVVDAENLGKDSAIPSGTATLEGIVWDSTAGKPLPGARVRVIGTDRGATTGLDGRFRIERIPPGRYEVGFLHSRLDSLGIPMPATEVPLDAGSSATVALSIPRLPTLLERLCPEAGTARAAASPRPAGDGIVLGRVMKADGGTPATDARVRVAWSHFAARGVPGSRTEEVSRRDEGVEVGVDASGGFHACGLPRDLPLRVWAEMGDLATDTATVRLDIRRYGSAALRFGPGS